jgi:hypothetical protein
MEVEAFLSDTVQAAGGKLHALGIGWRVLQTGGLPARHDRIGIGVIVRTPPSQAGDHQLRISLLGPGGSDLPLVAAPDGSTGTALEAAFGTPPGEGTATLALNLDGLVFQLEGDHAFVLQVDGNERARLPFRVQVASGQAAPDRPTTDYGTGMYL